MKKRFPLFIIDTSRAHGRERETDYIACTSSSLPFVAEATVIKETQYADEYNPDNYLVIYSEPRNNLRMRIRIVSIAEKHDKAEIRSLLRRAMKEMLTRRQTKAVDVENVSDDAVIDIINILLGQVYENLRENPNDGQQKVVKGVFEKIIERFNQNNEE